MREPLERWERSPKAEANAKSCIWACAIRLMKAGDPDANAHISMVGHRIGLSEYEINSAIRNAAKRTGWKPEACEGMIKLPIDGARLLTIREASELVGNLIESILAVDPHGLDSLDIGWLYRDN